MRWLFRPGGGFNWPVVLVFFAVVMIVGIAINQLVYDDWRCMFAECRIVKGDRSGD